MENNYPGQNPNLNPNPNPSNSPSNTYSILAIVFGGVAFFFIPLFVGVPAVIFAAIAKTKNEPLSTVALAVSLLGLIGGLIFGFLVGAIFL